MWSMRKTYRLLGSLLIVLHQQPVLAGPTWLGNWVDNTFNNGQRQADDRQRDEQRRDELDTKYKVIDACKQVIRSSIKNASTLQFREGPFNADRSRSEPTEGGWKAVVKGSTADGLFELTCYMDRSFRVTQVR